MMAADRMRIQLNGEPLTLPLVHGRRWVFMTRTKAGQYSISHVLEETEIKAIRKAQGADKEG